MIWYRKTEKERVYMYDDLKGKVALVTACSRGIGFAAVKMLVADGATVYMGVRSPEKSSQAVA